MTMWDQITDLEREAIVEKMIMGLATNDVPLHLRGGLVRYFSDGILPGSFLQAVLCNDLTQAIMRADPRSVHALTSLIECLQWHAPMNAWGSRAAVLAWTTTPERLEV
jgi:hypothetical protein